MESEKKDTNKLICRTDTDSQTEKFMVSKGDGWGNGLGVWDGKLLKLGCDDGCTTIIKNLKKYIKKIFKCKKNLHGIFSWGRGSLHIWPMQIRTHFVSPPS